MRPLLTTDQAAELLSVSAQWLMKSRADGTGPPFLRIGGAIRYNPLDLERHLDSVCSWPERMVDEAGWGVVVK